MASFVYNAGAHEIGTGATVFTSATINALLLKGSGYTPDRDHDFVSDLTPASNEVTVAGYVRKTLASKTVTKSDSNDRVEYDAADIVWSALTAGETISALVLFDNAGGADSARVLLAYIDLTDTPTNGGDITVVFDASGCFYLSTV